MSIHSPEGVDYELKVERRCKTLLQTHQSIIFGYCHKGLQDTFVRLHVRAACCELALQLDAGFDHLDRIRKKGGAHRGQAAQYKVRCGH